jgi:long-chain acyl-CoA synthetase
MTMALMVSTIFETASKQPNKTALIYGDEAICYEKLAVKIRSAATFLKNQGVLHGDRVILSALSTDPAFAYGYFACHLIGAIGVPVGGNIGSRALKEIAEQTRPRLSCLSQTPDFDLASAPLASLNCDSSLAIESAIASIDDAADILFTAGTTGKPKGIVQTHRNIKALADGRNGVIGVAASDKLVLPLPLSHGFGLGRLRCAMLAGGTVILIDGFVASDRIFQAFEQHDVRGFCCVPSGFATLFQLTGDKLGEYRHQLGYVETATAPLPNSLKERLVKLLPDTRIYNTYGLTETTATIAFVDVRTTRSQTMPVGKPVSSVQIKIVNEQREALPSGALGQVLIRGDNVMKCYWEDQARTKDVLIDGWLSTNDIGFLDDAGCLYLEGRKEDLINVGGNKVAPIEIESLLEEHPTIRECACIGIKDPVGLMGQTIKAFLVARTKQAPRPTDSELTNFLRATIENYKMPSQFVWVDELPKSPTGKLQRIRLQEREESQQAGHGATTSGIADEEARGKQPELTDMIRRTFSLAAETQVTDGDGPGSLDGWDSLGHVKLMVEIQMAYRIYLEPAEVMKIETVSDIRALLRNKGLSSQ